MFRRVTVITKKETLSSSNQHFPLFTVIPLVLLHVKLILKVSFLSHGENGEPPFGILLFGREELEKTLKIVSEPFLITKQLLRHI